jgi:tetratricopeptide (TPR) repeat protein
MSARHHLSLLAALTMFGCATPVAEVTGDEEPKEVAEEVDPDAPNERALGAATLESNRPTAACPLTQRPPDADFVTKRREILRVYKKLAFFMAPARRRAPKIVVKQGGKQVPPYYLPDSNRIVVGEKLHDICATFDADKDGCLAFFLGHELTHFTRGHMQSWDAFVTGAGETARAVAKHSNQQSEAQADEEGGFFSYLAGYDSLGVSESSLDAMYACYGLKTNLSGYLPLQGRRKVLQGATRRVAKLGLAFDAANHSMMIGRHDLAAALYDHVTARFASPETLNGAASARLMYAKTLIEASGGKAYAYPLTMDLSSRVKSWKRKAKRRQKTTNARGPALAGIGRGSGGEKVKDEKEEGPGYSGAANDPNVEDPTVKDLDDGEIQRDLPMNESASVGAAADPEPVRIDPKALALIEEAVELLEEVIDRHDPDYLPTLINLACAELMRGDQEAANRHIARALEVADREDAYVAEDDLRVLRAIMFDVQGEQEQALAELEQAAERRAEFARKTRDAITGEDTTPEVSAAAPERIGGWVINEKLKIKKPDLSVELPADMLGKELLTVKRKTTKVATAVEVSVDRRPMFLFVTVPKGYDGESSKGVRLGTPGKDVFTRYGAPETSMSTASGKSLHGFPDARIIFALGDDDKVSSWTVYYDRMRN